MPLVFALYPEAQALTREFEETLATALHLKVNSSICFFRSMDNEGGNKKRATGRQLTREDFNDDIQVRPRCPRPRDALFRSEMGRETSNARRRRN